MKHQGQTPEPNGDELLAALAALANPHRLRIIAALAGGRNYVSQLAREMRMSRPLLHMHLRKLEAAGLIRGSLTLSDDGKAMRFYELEPFALQLTPEAIAEAARTLSDAKPSGSGGPTTSDQNARRGQENETEEE